MNDPASLLENALVVDGSGGPAFRADVLLHGAHIAAIGADVLQHLPAGIASAQVQRRDCTGLVVAPGFIDAHTHDDAIALHQPQCLPKLSQGITSVVSGNCGISLAPYVSDNAGAPLNLLGAQHFIYPTWCAYADALARAQPAVNVYGLVGHTTLRYACVGDLARAASPDELAHMAALLQACLDEGAQGLSSGLFYEQAYAAPTDEVAALARVVGRHGGIYTSHLRSEMATILQAIAEAGAIAREGRLPLVISHHKCAGPSQWGRTRETLPAIEALAAQQPVAMDVYPYTAGSTVLREDLVDGQIEVLVTWSHAHPEQAGRSLAAIAEDWGLTQQQACRRLQPGGACYFQMSEEDVQRVIAHPLAMIGSDGLPHDSHPHPRLWGTFPRVLARYWREQRLFTLEQAIHKMTGLTAHTFRIQDRGLLRVGHFADVVLLDAQRIADTSTYDQPIRAATGIEAVWVNGVLSYGVGVEDGQAPRAGRVLGSN